jgi:hypothetical protein
MKQYDIEKTTKIKHQFPNPALGRFQKCSMGFRNVLHCFPRRGVERRHERGGFKKSIKYTNNHIFTSNLATLPLFKYVLLLKIYVKKIKP